MTVDVSAVRQPELTSRPRPSQGICVVNNFQGVHSCAAKQKTEDYRGLPLMTFPRVESPLETLSAQVHKDS